MSSRGGTLSSGVVRPDADGSRCVAAPTLVHQPALLRGTVAPAGGVAGTAWGCQRHSRLFARWGCTEKEKTVNPIHPGNEPDPGDMSTEPGTAPDLPADHSLPDAEAEELGNFA